MDRTRQNVELGLETCAILTLASCSFTLICLFGFAYWYVNLGDPKATGPAKDWISFATNTLRYVGALPLIGLSVIVMIQVRRAFRKRRAGGKGLLD